MSYATVMVCLALDQPNEARLEAACRLAERFDAGIVGIAASQIAPQCAPASDRLMIAFGSCSIATWRLRSCVA